MDPKSFFDKMLPYANKAHEQTHVPVSVILSQWAIESGFEASNWIGHNNYGGIRRMKNGVYQWERYPTISAFVSDYVKVLGLGYYDNVRAKAEAGASVYDVARELGRSPWDGGNYNSGKYPGDKLVSMIDRYNLTQYDDGSKGGFIGMLPDALQDTWDNLRGTWDNLTSITSRDFWGDIGQKSLLIILGVALLILGLIFIVQGE